MSHAVIYSNRSKFSTLGTFRFDFVTKALLELRKADRVRDPAVFLLGLMKLQILTGKLLEVLGDIFHTFHSNSVTLLEVTCFILKTDRYYKSYCVLRNVKAEVLSSYIETSVGFGVLTGVT
jgi:hypothetical protein